LGGWLSARNHRIMFEIQNRVYVVALSRENRISVGDEAEEVGPSYSFLTSSAPQLAVPVSFMALFDDAIMTTYAVSSPLKVKRMQLLTIIDTRSTTGRRRQWTHISDKSNSHHQPRA